MIVINEPEVKMRISEHFRKEGCLVDSEYYTNRNRIDFRIERFEESEMFIECKGDVFCNHDLIDQLNRYKSIVDNLYLAIPEKNIDRWKSFILYTEMDIGLICVKECGCNFVIERNSKDTYKPEKRTIYDLVHIFGINGYNGRSLTSKDIVNIYKSDYKMDYSEQSINRELIDLLRRGIVRRSRKYNKQGNFVCCYTRNADYFQHRSNLN